MCYLYFFHTSWCGKCKEFDKKLETDKTIPNIVSIDADTAPQEMIDTFEVQGLPTFVLVDKDENILGKLESPNSFNEFLGWYQGLTEKLKGDNNVN